MVRLLSEAARFSRLTDGAFDVTVQPLWQLYAEHFARPGADPEGPPTAAVEAVRALVDYRALRVEEDRVSFARRGMAATLNGIAQGYITDRVADRLRDEGMTSVLVDMGEVLAWAGTPTGAPGGWVCVTSGNDAGTPPHWRSPMRRCDISRQVTRSTPSAASATSSILLPAAAWRRFGHRDRARCDHRRRSRQLSSHSPLNGRPPC